MKFVHTLISIFLFIGMSVNANPPVADTLVGKQDNKNARTGEITLKDGVRYIGEVRLRRPHGTGKAIYRNGDIYEGEFAKGKRSGKGKMLEMESRPSGAGPGMGRALQGAGIFGLLITVMAPGLHTAVKTHTAVVLCILS